MGATSLTITHNMKSTQKIGDRNAMLYDGRIIWDGPASKARTSGNEYLDQFVHGPHRRTDRDDAQVLEGRVHQRRLEHFVRLLHHAYILEDGAELRIAVAFDRLHITKTDVIKRRCTRIGSAVAPITRPR